jgi:hypothetical protein
MPHLVSFQRLILWHVSLVAVNVVVTPVVVAEVVMVELKLVSVLVLTVLLAVVVVQVLVIVSLLVLVTFCAQKRSPRPVAVRQDLSHTCWATQWSHGHMVVRHSSGLLVMRPSHVGRQSA